MTHILRSRNNLWEELDQEVFLLFFPVYIFGSQLNIR
jgi:hypothetical protein